MAYDPAVVMPCNTALGGPWHWRQPGEEPVVSDELVVLLVNGDFSSAHCHHLREGITLWGVARAAFLDSSDFAALAVGL